MQHNYLRGGAALMVAAILGLSSCQQEPEFNTQIDAVEAPAQHAVIEGSYIVVLKKSAVTGKVDLSGDFDQRKQAVKSAVLSMFSNARLSEDMLYQVYGSTVLGFAAKMDEATANRLRKDPNVDYIEQDQMIILAKPGSGGSTSPVQETPPGITRVGGAINHTGKASVAWVIDTGIDLDHADLNVDASRGYNAFTTGRDAGSLDDGNGHGSHVAGTIAAIDNEIGVVGVAAGATVIPVKVLDSRGSGSYSGVMAGVDWVGANGKTGDVANMSLGGGVSQALDDAVVAAAAGGVAFCLAAGNDSDDANNHSPARANGPNVYTISAMDKNDVFASFSNWGNPPVDFCQPGVSIKSTWKDGGYNTISGTSMATPHAAGVILAEGGINNTTTSGNVTGETQDSTPDPILHR